MIGQVQKPMEEILEMLDGKEKLVLYGCGGCATVFHTGGEPEVRDMGQILFPSMGRASRLLLLRHLGSSPAMLPGVKSVSADIGRKLRNAMLF